MDDQREHALKIVLHVAGSNSKCVDAVGQRPDVAILISDRRVAAFMCKPINFNRETSRATEEVEHKWTARMLPAKLQAVGTHPEVPP